MTDRLRPTALITGASSGIGRDLARVFAKNHYHLILVARDRARLESLAAELHQAHLVQTRIEVCDLADEAALESLITRLESDHLVIDALVNNAGIGIEGTFLETEWKREREMIDLNVTALIRLTKAFLPQMVRRGSGRILQVASTAAFQPGPYLSLYFASKAFILSFSEGLSSELRGTGVTVTTLCPGPTHTDFERRLGVHSGLFASGLPVADSRAVAEFGYRSLMRGRRVAIHGFFNRLLASLSSIMPRGIVLLTMNWLIRRSAQPKNFSAP